MNIRTRLIDTLFFPTHFEEVPRTTDFDFITPQAFGRNGYPDDDCFWHFCNWFRRVTGKGIEKNVSVFTVRVIRDCFESDIDAFEKLKGLDFDPGCPNEILAEICVNLVQRKRVHIIGQWEVLYAIWTKFPKWYALNQDRFIAIWPPRKGYFGTRGLLLEVKQVADERGLSSPCVVAHPEHIQRVYFLAREIFGKPVAKMTEVMSDMWFDPKSVQLWTRGKWRWLFYEMLTRIHHRFHGWL